LELSRNQIWEDKIKPLFSLKINGIEHEIYNHDTINKITSYLNIFINKQMGLVARWGDVKDYVNNNENVTEIKLDPLGDNISIPYEDFYEFINKKEYIYLFRKNVSFDNMVKWMILKMKMNK
jgi:hypothetical protein